MILPPVRAHPLVAIRLGGSLPDAAHDPPALRAAPRPAPGRDLFRLPPPTAHRPP